jgi:hypothetical protein
MTDPNALTGANTSALATPPRPKYRRSIWPNRLLARDCDDRISRAFFELILPRGDLERHRHLRGALIGVGADILDFDSLESSAPLLKQTRAMSEHQEEGHVLGNLAVDKHHQDRKDHDA